MFNNFVIFTEVVKLSPNIFHSLKQVNYSKKLLKVIYSRKDIISFESVLDFIKDKELIIKFIKLIENISLQHQREQVENILIAAGSDERLLFCSSRNGFYEIVKNLVSSGVNLRSDLGSWALVEASYNGHVDIVKYLIERPDCKVCFKSCCHNADLHFKNDCAVRWASSCGKKEVVKYLIENGAILHSHNYPQKSLFISFCKLKCLNLLLGIIVVLFVKLFESKNWETYM